MQNSFDNEKTWNAFWRFFWRASGALAVCVFALLLFIRAMAA